MTKHHGLKDEGEVELTLHFTPDRHGEPGRIIFPAEDGSEERIFNVMLYPTADPNVVEVYSDTGHRIGTVTKAEPEPE